MLLSSGIHSLPTFVNHPHLLPFSHHTASTFLLLHVNNSWPNWKHTSSNSHIHHSLHSIYQFQNHSTPNRPERYQYILHVTSTDHWFHFDCLKRGRAEKSAYAQTNLLLLCSGVWRRDQESGHVIPQRINAILAILLNKYVCTTTVNSNRVRPG